jgi:hypothetical protein
MMQLVSVDVHGKQVLLNGSDGVLKLDNVTDLSRVIFSCMSMLQQLDPKLAREQLLIMSAKARLR